MANLRTVTIAATGQYAKGAGWEVPRPARGAAVDLNVLVTASVGLDLRLPVGATARLLIQPRSIVIGRGPNGEVIAQAMAWLRVVEASVLLNRDTGQTNFTLRGVPPAGSDGLPVIGSSVMDLFATALIISVPNSSNLGGVGTRGSFTARIVPVTATVGGDGVDTGNVRLTWFQADAEARAGVKIRRVGWTNKYLEFVRGLWFIQFFSATTKTLGERRCVNAGDFTAEDFRALDFTYEGLDGQPTTVGVASATVVSSLAFPA